MIAYRSLIRQRGECSVIPISGEVLGVPEWNTEENLSLERIPPLFEESLQGNLRSRLWVFTLLFDDVHSRFRQYNVPTRSTDAVRDCECVYHVGLVAPLHHFPLQLHKVDAVFHTRPTPIIPIGVCSGVSQRRVGDCGVSILLDSAEAIIQTVSLLILLSRPDTHLKKQEGIMKTVVGLFRSRSDAARLRNSGRSHA